MPQDKVDAQNSAASPVDAASSDSTNNAATGAVDSSTLETATQAGAQDTTLGEAATQMAGEATAQATTMPMESAFTWGSYFQAIGTLLLLLAVLWGLVWFVRKYGRFNFLPKPGAFPRDGLRLESQLPLGPRKGLMVVRFLNKRLLLGVTDHQITLLKETADDENENALEFKDIMEQAKCQKSDD